jgi:hypothetical protein
MTKIRVTTKRCGKLVSAILEISPFFDDGEIFADVVLRIISTIANRNISFMTVQNYKMQKVHLNRTKWNESK